MEISDPSDIATLPRTRGRTFFSQVLNLKKGLKFKRQEICAAIDGDSISVHEITNGRRIDGCALPPDLTLSCAPISFHFEAQATKYIYYVGTRRNTAELSVFQPEQDSNIRRPFSKSVALESNGVPIVQLDMLSGPASHYVLVILEDGGCLVYNADLSTCIRRSFLQHSAGSGRFLAAQCMSSQQASRSILKARPDVLTISDLDHSFVVGVLAETDLHAGTQSIGYGIWKIPSLNSLSSVEESSGPVLYHRFSISSPLLPKERDPIIFANKEKRLLIKTQSKVYVIDLTSVAPHIIQEIPPVAPDQLSSIYLSDSLTLSSTSSTIQLQNTQFRTLQTRLDLKETGLKRKRTPNSPGGPVILIAFFPRLGRVIATRRDHLVAIDLHVVGSDKFSTASKQSSLLINNIGRGAISQERLKFSDRVRQSLVGRSAKSSEEVDTWHKSVEQLEQYIQQEDFAKFEKACLDSLDFGTKIPSVESPILSNYKIDYILSKLFEYEDPADDAERPAARKIKLAFPAPELLGFLATAGFLTAEQLSKALRANNRFSFEPVKSGNISQILIDTDQSLNVLRKYLEGAPYIVYQELFVTLLLLLRRALAESSGPSQLTITTGQSTSSEPGKVITSSTTACLCTALERLADTAPSSLAIHMRNSFSQGEIIALIQFLRQQLFRSGYTRSLQSQSYPSPPASENGSSIDDKTPAKHDTNLSLGAMATILSICMDAIGPLGVLSFGDEEEFTQTLVPDLSSEITRATEAVQDAVFLSGILRETLRFAESTERTRTLNTADENADDDHKTKPGTIVTLYSEPTFQGNFDQSSSILPLGLRNEDDVNPTKVRKGDGKLSKRSVRDMGMHQDRLRGPYTFERLMI